MKVAEFINKLDEISNFRKEWYSDPERVQELNSKSKDLSELFEEIKTSQIGLEKLRHEMARQKNFSVKLKLASYLIPFYRDEALNIFFEAMDYDEHKGAARVRLIRELGKEEFTSRFQDR